MLSLFGQRELAPPLFLWFMGRMAGLRVRTEGVPREGALFLANHASWLDILALAGTSRAIFVAHSGLSIHGGLKWLCDQNDTVFIARDKRGSVAAWSCTMVSWIAVTFSSRATSPCMPRLSITAPV